MSDERKPPASVVTDLRVAHLAKAVTRKGEIHFELHVPENDKAADLAEDLRHGFFLEMPHVPAPLGPISVDEDKRDKSKLVVVYKPHGQRDLDKDRRELIRIFRKMDVPVTGPIEKGVRDAFDALKALSAPRHGSAVAAQLARRSTKNEPGGPGSP